jgi:hypothetical protein
MYSIRTVLPASTVTLAPAFARLSLAPPVTRAAPPRPVRGGDHALREVGRAWLATRPAARTAVPDRRVRPLGPAATRTPT